MRRLRHRPDQFFLRGDRYAFHRHQDGATLGRLDPYSSEPQRWLLHSGRTIDVTGEDVRLITKQVHDIDLPSTRPEGGTCSCASRVALLEARLAALEAQDEPTAPSVAEDAPDAPPPETVPEPQSEAAEPVYNSVEVLLGPLEELKARIDAVRAGEDLLEVEDLLEMVVDNPPGSSRHLEDAVRAIRGTSRRRLSELLNVELAELRNARGMVGEDLVREQQIEYLLGLFARLGEI